MSLGSELSFIFQSSDNVVDQMHSLVRYVYQCSSHAETSSFNKFLTHLPEILLLVFGDTTNEGWINYLYAQDTNYNEDLQFLLNFFHPENSNGIYSIISKYSVLHHFPVKCEIFSEEFQKLILSRNNTNKIVEKLIQKISDRDLKNKIVDLEIVEYFIVVLMNSIKRTRSMSPCLIYYKTKREFKNEITIPHPLIYLYVQYLTHLYNSLVARKKYYDFFIFATNDILIGNFINDSKNLRGKNIVLSEYNYKFHISYLCLEALYSISYFLKRKICIGIDTYLTSEEYSFLYNITEFFQFIFEYWNKITSSSIKELCFGDFLICYLLLNNCFETNIIYEKIEEARNIEQLIQNFRNINLVCNPLGEHYPNDLQFIELQVIGFQFFIRALAEMKNLDLESILALIILAEQYEVDNRNLLLNGALDFTNFMSMISRKSISQNRIHIKTYFSVNNFWFEINQLKSIGLSLYKKIDSFRFGEHDRHSKINLKMPNKTEIQTLLRFFDKYFELNISVALDKNVSSPKKHVRSSPYRSELKRIQKCVKENESLNWGSELKDYESAFLFYIFFGIAYLLNLIIYQNKNLQANNYNKLKFKWLRIFAETKFFIYLILFSFLLWILIKSILF